MFAIAFSKAAFQWANPVFLPFREFRGYSSVHMKGLLKQANIALVNFSLAFEGNSKFIQILEMQAQKETKTSLFM